MKQIGGLLKEKNIVLRKKYKQYFFFLESKPKFSNLLHTYFEKIDIMYQKQK